MASLSVPMNSNFQQSNLFAFTYPKKEEKKRKTKENKKEKMKQKR